MIRREGKKKKKPWYLAILLNLKVREKEYVFSDYECGL